MSHVIPGDLPALCRERAAVLREYGDPHAARLWELAASERERALKVFGAKTLSRTEAARSSGHTADQLAALELATLEWVWWFNHHRSLEALGSLPPAEYEAPYLKHQAAPVAA